MNTTLKAITVVGVAALAGCGTAPEQKAAEYCADLGLEAGTPAYQGCHVQMTQHYGVLRAQAAQTAAQGFSQGFQGAQSQRQSTTCNMIGNSVYCDSY